MADTTARILTLLGLLQTHRQWSGPELADRLGVTERTLRRDIETVRQLGYSVVAMRGPAGGYRLEAGSRMPPLLLTDDEAVTMAIGLRVAATQDLVGGESTSLSALAKFEQVLPSGLRERVNALSTHVQSPTPRGARVSQELLGSLALAARDHERIRFDYRAPTGEQTSRVVEPHALVASERRWLLVCWDVVRADWRTFRVDRMSRFFATHLRFAPRELPAEDAAEYVMGAVSGIRPRRKAEVILSMPLERMREHFGDWTGDAHRVDDATTSWPIEAETVEQLFGALAWIPAGVHYQLTGDEEFLRLVDGASQAMRAAIAPK